MAGLIKKLPGRGHEVCKVSLGDLEMVIKLRGILEGAAAAALASNGVQETTRKDLACSIEMTLRIMLRRRISMDDVAAFKDANALFHETIMRDCGNECIALSYDQSVICRWQLRAHMRQTPIFWTRNFCGCQSAMRNT